MSKERFAIAPPDIAGCRALGSHLVCKATLGSRVRLGVMHVHPIGFLGIAFPFSQLRLCFGHFDLQGPWFTA